MKTTYVTIAAILLLIAPMVAGADESQPTETLPCPADHAEATTTEATTTQTTNTETQTETALAVEEAPQATVTTTETTGTETANTEATTTETAAVETASTTETSVITTPPTSYPAGAVIITELYPAPPTGAAEWVELWNATNVTIDLAGFALTDAGGARTTLEGSIAAGDYFLISNPKGKLNNDGDTIALFDATNTQLDVASYASGIDRTESFARSGIVWFVTTTPTPLGPNIVSGDAASTSTNIEVVSTSPSEPLITTPLLQTEPVAITPPPADLVPVTIVATAAPDAIRVETETAPTATETAKPKSTSTKTSKPASEAAREVVLLDVKNLKLGTIVRTQGVVSVPPGIFGASTFYVAGSGIRVSLFGVSAPSLAVGDVVALEGKLGSTQGELRIAISKLEGLAVVTHGEPPIPHVIAIGEIGDETEGWLVTTEGVVVQKLNGRFILDDGAGSVPVVSYEAAHLDMTSISIGDALRVTGIVSETSAGFRLLPRSSEDVVVTSHTTTGITTGSSRSHISLLSVLAGLCAAALVGMVIRKQIINRQKPMVLKRPLVM